MLNVWKLSKVKWQMTKVECTAATEVVRDEGLKHRFSNAVSAQCSLTDFS